MWAAGLRTPGVRVERDTRTVTGGVVAASLHTTVLRILVAWCNLSMLLLDTSNEVGVVLTVYSTHNMCCEVDTSPLADTHSGILAGEDMSLYLCSYMCKV